MAFAVLAACGGSHPAPGPLPSSLTPRPIDPDLSFGGLGQGMPAEQAVAILGAPASKESVHQDSERLLWVANWSWPEGGIVLEMASGSQNEQLVIESLDLKPNCKLKTPKGIGIGSTRAEVIEAYGTRITGEPTENEIVVGPSPSAVFFGLTGDKVTAIFVGEGVGVGL